MDEMRKIQVMVGDRVRRIDRDIYFDVYEQLTNH